MTVVKNEYIELIKYFESKCPYSLPHILSNAINNGRHKLLSQKYFTNSTYSKILSSACEYNDIKTIQRLIDLGGNPRTLNNKPLKEACKNGNLELVKLLIEENDCDYTEHSCVCFILACKHGHMEVVKHLISIGVNTQTRKNSAIMRAYENNHLDIVALLFSYGCDSYGIPEDHIYEVLQEYKIKLLTLWNKVGNNYLKMEILKMMMPKFSCYEIMSII